MKRSQKELKLKKPQHSFMEFIYSWYSFKQNMMICKVDILMSRKNLKVWNKNMKNRNKFKVWRKLLKTQKHKLLRYDRQHHLKINSKFKTSMISQILTSATHFLQKIHLLSLFLKETWTWLKNLMSTLFKSQLMRTNLKTH